MVLVRGWGRGNGELFNGDRVAVLQDAKVVERVGGAGHMAM